MTSSVQHIALGTATVVSYGSEKLFADKLGCGVWDGIACLGAVSALIYFIVKKRKVWDDVYDSVFSFYIYNKVSSIVQLGLKLKQT